MINAESEQLHIMASLPLRRNGSQFPTSLHRRDLCTTCMLYGRHSETSSKRTYRMLVSGPAFTTQYLCTCRTPTRGSDTGKETFRYQRMQLGGFFHFRCIHN